jgi:PAS domain S-box-containing protein
MTEASQHVGAPPPPDERMRLAAVHALALLDTPREERFDRITRTAQRLLGTPMALISLVDVERQWFKSCQGLDVNETDRSASFCAHAIHADDPFVIPDAHADERFVANPLVTGPPFIRAYLGIPLHNRGHRIGTLCVLDDQPREFTPDDIASLTDLARWGEAELDHTELAEVVALQRATEERLQAVLEAVPEGVATFDAGGRILTLNPAGERLYGCSAAQLVGQDVGTLLADGEQRQTLAGRVATLAPGDEPVRIELTGRRADGLELPLEVSVGRILVEGGAGYVVAARDLTERRRAEEAVLGIRRRLELILEAAAEGICGLDARGLVVFANPAARRMFGLGADEEIAGVSLHERFHSRRPDGSPYPWHECPSYRTLRDGEPVRVANEVFFRADGTEFAVEYASAPIIEHETVSGVVVSFTDVTARRAVERMKDEFVSVVSHELRTPLTSIRGSLGLLASGAVGHLSQEAQRMADIAVSNTDRLVRLVNDILDLERIESGEIELHRSSVPVGRLLDDAVASVAGVAERAHVDIRVSKADGLVWVDADRMVQALANLLSNAVKFSQAGQVVELNATLDAERLELQVADQGRGIPAGMLERIFDRFQQVDATDARERAGTGLGLAIVKSIVEQHGGTVSVESAPGRGSVFIATFPCDLASPEAEAPARPERERPVVLVVEDDADLAEVLSTSLAHRGIDVVRADRQSSAVSESARVQPDLIVLDLTLAEGDGYGVVEELRRDRVLASTPVLVYTVRDLNTHERRRLLLGPTEFLTKGSAHPADIEERVLRMVGPPEPRSGRQVLMVDDDPDIQAVALVALEVMGGYSVVLAGSGEEGVRLAREHLPDVILLDVMMPGLDGPATLVRLREDPATAGIPVVFLTAKAQATERERLAGMHVAGILSKPFDPMSLAGELGHLMGWS